MPEGSRVGGEGEGSQLWSQLNKAPRGEQGVRREDRGVE